VTTLDVILAISINTCEKPLYDTKELDVLTQVLPSVPLTQLKFLLEISRVLMWCPISSLKLACIDGSDVQRLQIDQYGEEDLESLAEEANAFTKAANSVLKLCYNT